MSEARGPADDRDQAAGAFGAAALAGAARPRLLWYGLGIALLAGGADRISKWWLLDVFGLATHPPVHVSDFLNIVMVWNQGVSFGLLAGEASWHRLLLAGFAVAVSLALGVALTRTHSRWAATGFGLVIGGALSNAWDRVTYGAVADFLDFHAGSYHWYAFNIADAAITVGAALLVADGLFGGRPERR